MPCAVLLSTQMENDKCMHWNFLTFIYVLLTSYNSKVDRPAITPPFSDSDLYPIVTLIFKLCIINDQFWRVEKYTSMKLPFRDTKICHVWGIVRVIVPIFVFSFLPSYLSAECTFASSVTSNVAVLPR